MSNLFGLNVFNNTGFNPYRTNALSAFQSQSVFLQNPFASAFSGQDSLSSLLPLILRGSAHASSLGSTGSGQDLSGLMTMLMLKKLMGRATTPSISQTVVNPLAQVQNTQVTTVDNSKQQEIERLRADADATLKGLKFSADELKAMQGKHKDDQYADTVTKAYGLAWRRGVAKFTSGAFAGTNNNSVTTQNLIDKNLMPKDWNWNLDDLESAFGAGTLQAGSKAVLKDLSSTLAAGSAYHSSPFHLGQAQKLLDKSRAITDFMSKNCVNDSALEAKAKELKEIAKLHYSIAGTTESPVILDTDGNGKIDLTSVKDGVQFDIDGDGKKDQVAWTQAKGDKTDAWLALDRNGNGSIDSGKELFGNQHGLANGYEELKKFDDNKDGVIDAQDAIYSKLKTWKDTNHDGLSQASEMQDLKSAGVESVNIGYKNSTEKDAHGNELRQQSAFTRTDAEAAKLAQSRGGTAAQFKSGLSVDAWVQTLRG